MSLLVGCGNGGGFPDAAPTTGTFSVSWTVNDTAGKAVPCDQIGATMVEASTMSQGMDGPTENFICSSAQGQSEGFVPGRYDIGFTLTTSAGNLVTAPAQTGVTIVGGQNTPLQPVTFTVDATGNIALTLSTGAASNCAGGPRAIQAMTFAVEHSSNGTCAPMTLDIAAGATKPAGTYNVDCMAMAYPACVENDQVIAAMMPFTSGRYTFRVRGQIGGKNCWAADVAVQVPPLGGVVTQTVPLVYNSMVMGCP